MAQPQVDDFQYGDHRLVYETHGEGNRVVVLLHGLLLDAGLNRALAQSLAARGNRVVLLDLLGHGRSDRPPRATAHRMDRYADQCIALLDHLGVEQAVLGGPSLGANVSLFAAVRAPQRVRGMIIEMPVLEWAAPAAGAIFIPMLMAVHYMRRIALVITRAMGRVPRTGFGPLDSALNTASMHPDEMAAVLHGMLVGPTAPAVEERSELLQPTLIIGHGRDVLHPFSDATNLHAQLRNSRIIQAKNVMELRVRPTRLTGEIVAFLDEVWQPHAVASDTGS